MKGDIRFSIVGMMLLLTLAGCGRGFFQFGERAAWRHDAEVACLKSGDVKFGAGVVQIEPIEGSGICGADFPLKVAALGEYSPRLGYAEDLSPPANVPAARMPPQPVNEPRYSPPSVRPTESRALQSPPIQNGSMRWITGPAGIERREAGAPAGSPLSLRPPSEAPVDTAVARSSAEPQIRPAFNATGYLQPPRQTYGPPVFGPAGGQQMAANMPIVLSPPATLACPIVSALDRWVNDGVQPAALRWFGTAVVKIQQISAYSCRAMVGSGSSTISEHAFGNALDIAGFTLADGRAITVKDGWHGTPEEQGFLHDVQLYACETFTTVLAPGYNVYHYNHIHVDLMRRASGNRPCRPDAIPGEVVAAKARARYANQRGGPAYNGSNGARGFTPQAVAGEDGYVADDDSRGRATKISTR